MHLDRTDADTIGVPSPPLSYCTAEAMTNEDDILFLKYVTPTAEETPLSPILLCQNITPFFK